jgi:hypothetical protein
MPSTKKDKKKKKRLATEIVQVKDDTMAS